jgi:hypothetical protein
MRHLASIMLALAISACSSTSPDSAEQIRGAVERLIRARQRGLHFVVIEHAASGTEASR